MEKTIAVVDVGSGNNDGLHDEIANPTPQCPTVGETSMSGEVVLQKRKRTLAALGLIVSLYVGVVLAVYRVVSQMAIHRFLRRARWKQKTV